MAEEKRKCCYTCYHYDAAICLLWNNWNGKGKEEIYEPDIEACPNWKEDKDDE